MRDGIVLPVAHMVFTSLFVSSFAPLLHQLLPPHVLRLIASLLRLLARSTFIRVRRPD